MELYLIKLKLFSVSSVYSKHNFPKCNLFLFSAQLVIKKLKRAKKFEIYQGEVIKVIGKSSWEGITIRSQHHSKIFIILLFNYFNRKSILDPY